MKHIAIILARGRSKRLPRKNIIEFHGKPMIAWTIESALRSQQYHRVLVSTDDEEIAKISRTFGAEVPFMRLGAADDFTSSSEATLVALKQAEEFWGEQYSVVSQLMANCPLRNADDISNSVKNFIKKKAVSQLSCFKFGWMNPWWAGELDEEGRLNFIFPEALGKRSQDFPSLYCPSGAIWIATSEVLKKEKTFYGPNNTFYPLSWVSAMDIDDIDDLQMARVCFNRN